MATKEQQLFEIVERIGEQLMGDLHVIDMTDSVCYPDDKKFRVYHSKGYCFDVERLTEASDETDEITGFDYSVYDEWDGFEKLDVQGYINLLKNEGYN